LLNTWTETGGTVAPAGAVAGREDEVMTSWSSIAPLGRVGEPSAQYSSGATVTTPNRRRVSARCARNGVVLTLTSSSLALEPPPIRFPAALSKKLSRPRGEGERRHPGGAM